jgi:hypothetical protein
MRIPAVFVPLLAAALAGCPDRDLSEVVPAQDKQELLDVPVKINRDVDILFVIDNSGSMEEEQTSLAANFPSFIARLETIEGGLPNVHIGVVSSDVGAGPWNIAMCSGDGDNGMLQTTPRVAGCSPPDGAFIVDVVDDAGARTTNYSGTLADTFSCIARLGTTGCGFEQHLESMRRALDGTNGFNAGFLREDAYLAVIFIADEDDCSTRDAQMFDTSASDELGPLSSFRCFEFGVDCETGNADPRAPGPRTGCRPREESAYMHGVQEYVDFLKSLKDDDRLIIAAGIVGNAEPVAVGRDPERPENPALVPSCQSGAGKADPAVRLTTLLDQFPGRSAFTTICNDNLADALEIIAELLKNVLGDPCVEGTPKDVNPELAGTQVECVVGDVVDPGTEHETETILPHCNAADAEDLDPAGPPVSTNLPCWHLTPNPDRCADTPTQLALIVERGGESVPTGTHVQARCVTE